MRHSPTSLISSNWTHSAHERKPSYPTVKVQTMKSNRFKVVMCTGPSHQQPSTLPFHPPQNHLMELNTTRQLHRFLLRFTYVHRRLFQRRRHRWQQRTFPRRADAHPSRAGDFRGALTRRTTSHAPSHTGDTTTLLPRHAEPCRSLSAATCRVLPRPPAA